MNKQVIRIILFSYKTLLNITLPSNLCKTLMSVEFTIYHFSIQHSEVAFSSNVYHYMYYSFDWLKVSVELALPVSVSESVESVFTWGLDGGDISNHTGTGIPHEGILQDVGQLALTERLVFTLLVNGANALLQLNVEI